MALDIESVVGGGVRVMQATGSCAPLAPLRRRWPFGRPLREVEWVGDRRNMPDFGRTLVGCVDQRARARGRDYADRASTEILLGGDAENRDKSAVRPDR